MSEDYSHLRFQCQPGCTVCCDREGWVYVTDEDVLRISEYLGMKLADFEQNFIYRTKKTARLRVPKNANCTFLSEGGCSIHDVKPVQCRTFPFWPELIGSRRDWFETGKWCPGIGQGGLVNIETAKAQADEMAEAYPHFYEAK